MAESKEKNYTVSLESYVEQWQREHAEKKAKAEAEQKANKKVKDGETDVKDGRSEG